MVALTEGRNTPQRTGDAFVAKVAAGAVIYSGAILMRDANGYVLPGAPAAGLLGVGVAMSNVDNAGGADGDEIVEFRVGLHRFENAATDTIDIDHISKRAFIHDDQTVGRTNGGNTRSAAGLVQDVDDQGVWVRFDELLLQAANL